MLLFVACGSSTIKRRSLSLVAGALVSWTLNSFTSARYHSARQDVTLLMLHVRTVLRPVAAVTVLLAQNNYSPRFIFDRESKESQQNVFCRTFVHYGALWRMLLIFLRHFRVACYDLRGLLCSKYLRSISAAWKTRAEHRLWWRDYIYRPISSHCYGCVDNCMPWRFWKRYVLYGMWSSALNLCLENIRLSAKLLWLLSSLTCFRH